MYETHWLTISSVTADFSSFVVAKLIDVSTEGFGVSTLEPTGAHMPWPERFSRQPPDGDFRHARVLLQPGKRHAASG
jgi:hypothetical protein